MQTRRYVVQGRVQGVGFRYATRHAAQRLEISGWVRNRVDGSVEVMARADLHRLKALESFLQRGPFGARVDQFEKEEMNDTDVGDGFTIRF